VTFEFSPRQRVVTPWGDMGVISDAAINEDGGHLYYVERDRNSKWIRGDLLQNAGGPAPTPTPGPVPPDPDPIPGPFPRDFPPYDKKEKRAVLRGPRQGYQPDAGAREEGVPGEE
jgi:hypothetical protein